MSTSTISICNNALRKIGANVITSLEQDTEEAKACKSIFQETLDEMLAQYKWNFAMCRSRLARLDSTPAFEYEYEYQLPTDPYCLTIRKVVNASDNVIEYKIEGRKLLTDTDGVYILYTKRVTDMNELTPLFKSALIYNLASSLAMTLAEDTATSNTMYQKHELVLRRARAQDAQEGTPDELAEGSWITCRYT